jgi:hypothetical protein
MFIQFSKFTIIYNIKGSQRAMYVYPFYVEFFISLITDKTLLTITDSTSFHNYNRAFLLGKNPISAFSLLNTIIGICSKHSYFGDKIYIFILVCETQIKIYACEKYEIP